jgi:hypothetical protein
MSSIISKSAARDELWRRGSISLFKLDPAQKDFNDKVRESNEKIIVILSSRRLGKTFWAICLAIETCLRKPNAVVKFLAPTKLMINDIIDKMMPIILEDCPDQLKPLHQKSKHAFKFHNGSRLEMAGTDSGHAEKLRGGFADLCIVDEAGFCNDLTNTVRSVLIPTTTNTRGKIILLSTPPKDLEHDFIKFIEEADIKGVLIKKTIFENPRVLKEEIDEILAAYPGGLSNPDFRREYLCEILKDEQRSVLPEFTEELEKQITLAVDKPPFYDYYEAMDLGGKDLTVVLFTYFDFKNARVVVEDEVVIDFQIKDNNIKKLVQEILQKEKEHYSDPLVHEVRKPFMRVSDINYIVLKEILEASHNQISFSNTRKDDKLSAINNLRIMLADKRIIIHPRCKTLLRHLRNVKWSKNNKSLFDRSIDNGHYDAVDALIYLIRTIVYGKNPYPSNYGMNQNDLMILGGTQNKDKTVEIFRNLFGVGKKYGR